MRTQRFSGSVVWGASILLALTTLGCSTKKFVLKTVAPVETRTAQLEKKSAEHETQIEALQTKVSATDERAMTADSKAQAAAQSAANAQRTAEQAGSTATDAQKLAQTGLNKAGQVEHGLTNLSSKVDNLDNYALVSSETVQFRLNSSELTKEAEGLLDSEIQKLSSEKHFVIEVEGFTDTTGPDAFNLELSRRRADAVVRYLTGNGKIPLYRVHVVGYGKADPVASNANLQGREANRRVEIKWFAPETAPTGQQTASARSSNP